MSSGQDLLNAANESVDGAGGYDGPYFRGSVKEAMKQNRPEKHVKRRLRKDEAVSTVSHIFDNARKQDVTTLDKVADQAGKDPKSSPELQNFSLEVATKMNETEGHSGGFGIVDPVTLISLISTIVSTIVPLFQSCRKPAPAVVPPATT